MRYRNLLALLLIAWLYASILARLFLQSVGPSHDPNFEHGIFVPIFALFVLWHDRAKLKAIASAPSWAGLPLVVLSLLMLFLGVLGGELFFSRVSLLVLLAGLIVLLQGWTFFRAVLFPWAFLILMIPIPNLILQQVTHPLQLLASKLASTLLYLAGVPVLRQGNVIMLPAMLLDVAEAESGIRSILTLLTVVIIYGYLVENRSWVRVVLACATVPIVVAANSFRIFGTGLFLQYLDPDKAERFFHVYSGWLVFVVALIMLFILHRVIARIWKSSPEAKSSVQLPATTTSTIVRTKEWSLRFAIAAVLMLVAALVLQSHSRSEFFPPRESLSSLPTQIDGWTGQDISLDQQTMNIFAPQEILLRDYQHANQREPRVALFIDYLPSQNGAQIHSEGKHCLLDSGWVPTLRDVVEIARPDGSSFSVNRCVVSKAGDRELVLDWYQAHGRAVASEYWAEFYLEADSIRMNRTDGALVQLMTPMLDAESPDAAQVRMMRLGSQLLPMLDRYIPR